VEELFDQLPDKVDELIDSFLSIPIVGDLNVGFTQYDFWLAVAIVVLLVLMFTFIKKQSRSLVPEGRFVNGMEFVVEYTRKNMVQDIVGPTWREHFPFIATVFFFVLVNNIIGVIPGCHPGTGCIGVTAALALVSFIYFIVMGVRKHGVGGYLKTFSHGLKGPMGPAIWLVEVFSTFLRLITLAVRLFCNLFAGHIVMGTFAILTSLFATQLAQGISLMAFGSAGISLLWLAILIIIYVVELLVAAIQAFVFAMLSAVYVQIAEEEE
jgi:F-type H+-transporting ATPase subunit a